MEDKPIRALVARCIEPVRRRDDLRLGLGNGRALELLSDGDKRYLVGHDTLGWEDAGGWTYAVPDALGSVRQAVDAAGAVVAAREWTPYGVEVGGTQAGLGYTGEWYDASVGLQYLRARWYASQSGRFTTVDPWVGDPSRPQSLNDWAYVEGNPVNLTDPHGLRGILPWNQYYQHWGRSWVEGSSDIVLDLGSIEDELALRSISKIELNFQGNPNYEGESPVISLVASLYGACVRRSLHNSSRPDDMIAYTTQPIYPDRDYNRYDWLISGWVDYWNWRARREGKVIGLDPNFFKAIAYKETTIGYNQPVNDTGYEGVVQLGADALAALLGNSVGSVTWGAINVVDVHNPSQNIAGGVRWLIYKREVSDATDWYEAYAYYAGFGGDISTYPIQQLIDLYKMGLDPHYSPGGENYYLFRRSSLFPYPWNAR